jgi:hypothetical protein
MALKESNTGPMVIKKNGGGPVAPLFPTPHETGPMLDQCWTIGPMLFAGIPIRHQCGPSPNVKKAGSSFNPI